MRRQYSRRSRPRSSIVVTACLLLAALVSGCGAAQGAQSATTLTVWYSTDDPVERVWSQHLARSFNASHPTIHVRLVDYSFEDLNTKLQLALSGGNPPDLAYVTPRGPGIPAYVGAHRLLDLTSAARAHGWAARLRPGLLADYNRPFPFYGGRRGEIVGVPTALAAVGVLYNERLLAQLHLAVPRSLSAFQTALARAARAGYTPIGIGNGDGWLGDDWYLTLVNALLPRSALAPEQVLAPGFSFHRPPFLAAGRLLQTWSKANYLTPDFGGLDAQEGVDQFFRGKTLFQLISSSENAQILHDQQQTGLPIGVFAFPRSSGGGTVPVSGYLGWVVPAASHHPQQAIDFITSLLSPPITRFLLRRGVLPAARGSDSMTGLPGWQQQYLHALDTAEAGIYLDAAPIPNINATMEANVQLLLQGYELPSSLVNSLQEAYSTHGNRGSTSRIDGEF